jgi:hypothetical protein
VLDFGIASFYSNPQSRDQINHKIAQFIETHVGLKEASVMELLDYNSEGNFRNNGNKMSFQLKQCIKYGRKVFVII